MASEDKYKRRFQSWEYSTDEKPRGRMKRLLKRGAKQADKKIIAEQIEVEIPVREERNMTFDIKMTSTGVVVTIKNELGLDQEFYKFDTMQDAIDFIQKRMSIRKGEDRDHSQL